LLAELGADVIKLEPPGGDQARQGISLGSPGFTQLNVGKRAISVDFDVPESKDLVRRLIGVVDVVIENFRPGVMAAWGLDYASLAADYPSLIYLSISGYGQRGSWRHRRAYAPFVHAETGYLHTVAQLRQAPLEHDPMSVADLAAGKDATIAVLAALVERQRSGNGGYIDMSLAHSILFFNEFATALLNPKGRPPRSGSSPQTIFVTADGQGFSAGNPVSRQVFAPLCRALGCPGLIDDARFVDSGARRARRAELIAALQDAVARRGTIDEIQEAINAEGLVIGRVRPITDVVETEWVAERGALMSVSNEAGEEVLIPSAPWTSSPTERRAGLGVGRIGANNTEVLGQLLGLSESDISGLEERGVLCGPTVDRAGRPEDSSGEASS
jgi:crotonobetainyl-CoA:carnitine CoA-transferase CaiB-like acyl-CoA transferase